jgi:hypothetical protein
MKTNIVDWKQRTRAAILKENKEGNKLFNGI